MIKNWAEWASEHGQTTKIRLSEACGRDAVLFAVERWYDFPEFGGYLALGQDYETGSGSSKFEWDVVYHGPLFAFSFRF
ncbi:MAG: hypothetical protein O6829_11215 [Alphaproteobacteria bacterium]|nr:hypothetical protein [Alphaproteobacteria bacterium]